MFYVIQNESVTSASTPWSTYFNNATVNFVRALHNSVNVLSNAIPYANYLSTFIVASISVYFFCFYEPSLNEWINEWMSE